MTIWTKVGVMFSTTIYRVRELEITFVVVTWLGEHKKNLRVLVDQSRTFHLTIFE